MRKVKETLQSIDGTLKRIEAILLDRLKPNQCSQLDTLRDAVEEAVSEKKASKKKKTSKAMRTPKKPLSLNITLDGETILRQTQAFEREFQKQIGRITDG